jgi:hypothetical protein
LRGVGSIGIFYSDWGSRRWGCSRPSAGSSLWESSITSGVAKGVMKGAVKGVAEDAVAASAWSP